MNESIVKFFTATLLILIATQLPAQELATDLGGINKVELSMPYYEKDSSASAVVLFDIGKSVFIREGDRFYIKFTRKTRIKIFNKSGYQYANVQIPFYNEGNIREKVKNIKAISYFIEDGLIMHTKLNQENIFTENINKRWNRINLAIPGVKEGAILEYSYELTTPYTFNLPDWDFQWTIPVVHSSYEVHVVPFYEYIFVLQGAKKLDSEVSYVSPSPPRRFGALDYQDMVHKMAMFNVPAFQDESYITSINDYKVKLDFQLTKIIQPDGTSTNIMSTWPTMIKDFIKSKRYGQYMKASKRYGQKLVDKLTPSTSKKITKIEAIIDHVKSNYLWNGQYSKYATKNVTEFVKQKRGNSAEINLFLAGLLQAADIDAVPVLISTRDHGKVHTDYPFSHYFNSSLILITTPELVFLADGTSQSHPFYQIPLNTLNELGLVVTRDFTRWISLNLRPSKTETKLKLFLNIKEGQLNVESKSLLTRYDAVQYKTRYQNDHALIIKALSEKGYQDVNLLKTENHDNINEDFKVSYRAIATLESFGERAYVSPFINETSSIMVLKGDNRGYPVDIDYTKERRFISTIKIPGGYSLENKIENYFIDDELVKITYTQQTLPGSIQIIASYLLKKQIYQPSEYQALKKHLSTIHSKFNERLVFVKQ